MNPYRVVVAVAVSAGAVLYPLQSEAAQEALEKLADAISIHRGVSSACSTGAPGIAALAGDAPAGKQSNAGLPPLHQSSGRMRLGASTTTT